MALLELKNLSKAFGGLQVIDNLDFSVAEHEIVSVIGPNGAGKTTLFNLVTGVYRPDSGEILFEGESIVGAILLTQLKGWWRVAVAPPVFVVTAFVWENLLIQQPAVTRYVLFGALLIALMTSRPQGLFGTAKVEIV